MATTPPRIPQLRETDRPLLNALCLLLERTAGEHAVPRRELMLLVAQHRGPRFR